MILGRIRKSVRIVLIVSIVEMVGKLMESYVLERIGIVRRDRSRKKIRWLFVGMC